MYVAACLQNLTLLLLCPPASASAAAAAVVAAAGCSACAGISIFGAFFMFLLGVLIQNNYQ
jgi:hypothetical protein